MEIKRLPYIIGNDDIKDGLKDGLINCWERIQCTHPGCMNIGPYIQDHDNSTIRCIFHGDQPATGEITSPWMLSFRRIPFRKINGGHMSLYITKWDNKFAGVMIHARGQHLLVESFQEITTMVPKEYRNFVREIFEMAGHLKPNLTKIKGTPRPKAEPKPKAPPKPKHSNSAVICAVCGFSAPAISKHIIEHGLDKYSYRAAYPGAMLICKDLIAKYLEKSKGGG